jgi:hypothetical protein
MYFERASPLPTDIVYDRQAISVPAVWAGREADSEIWRRCYARLRGSAASFTATHCSAAKRARNINIMGGLISNENGNK